MKLIFILFLFINPVNDPNRISEVNSLKKEAKEAYTQGNFDQAVQKYEKLVSEYDVRDENVMMNLANAYYKNENVEKAMELYANLNGSTDNDIRSAAFNQSGIIAHLQKKKEEAINLFKEALKANPSNEAARFNYSKLKKEMEEEQKQDEENKDDKNQEENKDKKDQNKEQEKKDGDKKEGEEDKKEEGKEGEDEKEQENKEGEAGEEGEEGEEKQPPQPSTQDKLQEMNMSEEKAQMILEAMKNNEVQYIQQSKKKPQSRPDDGKPDW